MQSLDLYSSVFWFVKYTLLLVPLPRLENATCFLVSSFHIAVPLIC